MLDKFINAPYYFALKLRHFAYDHGLCKVRTAPVPTICVGNVTAGGTGKTPHTELILRMLLESDEWGLKNVAMLSRGYKRESSGFQQVTTDGSSSTFGDEPLQIKRKFPTVTVAVCKDRVEGCRFLADPKLLETKRSARKCWNKKLPPADIVVLDDAFQYRGLKATRNIVLVDYNRPVFKDHLIPFGRLRDLPSRLSEADVIVVTKCPSDMDDWQKSSFASGLGFKDFRTSTCRGTNAAGKEQLVLFSYVKYGQFSPIFENSDPRYIYSKRLVLFTGIARDMPLRRYLSDKYKIVRHLSFRDHHKFRWSDFQKIARSLKRWPTAAVATTEKDAQRVMDYNGLPPTMKERLFMIPIEVEFLTPEERELFRNAVILS